jgi:tetratricopeptide (TPR) repeat protein
MAKSYESPPTDLMIRRAFEFPWTRRKRLSAWQQWTSQHWDSEPATSAATDTITSHQDAGQHVERTPEEEPEGGTGEKRASVASERTSEVPTPPAEEPIADEPTVLVQPLKPNAGRYVFEENEATDEDELIVELAELVSQGIRIDSQTAAEKIREVIADLPKQQGPESSEAGQSGTTGTTKASDPPRMPADIEIPGAGLRVALPQERRDITAAVAAWQHTIDSGNAGTASLAAYNLGVLLQEQGDVQAAQRYYRQAIESDDAGVTPKAAYHLGVLLQEQGDVQAAQAAYQRAIDSGHADSAPKALVNLGNLFLQEGDGVGAQAAWERAVESRDARAYPQAAYNLGVLLQQRGDLNGARAAWQVAIDSGDPESAPQAAYNLGVLLQQRGDLDGAQAAWQVAIDSGHTKAAPKAAYHLSVLLEQREDPKGAQAFRRTLKN